MSTRISDVLRALARQMHNLEVATYQPTGAYPASTPHPAVTFGKLPATPSAAVALNHYNTDPDFGDRFTPLLFVQLRWRAATLLAVNDLIDDANAALTVPPSAPVVWPGGVHVQWMVRTTSSVPPAVEDGNGRVERPDNYEIRLNPGD